MKKQPRVRALISFILVAFCTVAMGREVRLVYANAQSVPSQYGGDRTAFKVHVKNWEGTTNKSVYIDYISQLYKTPSSFMLTLEKDHGRHASFEGMMYDLPDSFVVRYVSDAGTFYDDNNGAKYHTDASSFEGAVGYGIGMLNCKRSYSFRPLHLDPTNYPVWAYLSLSGQVCLDDPSRAGWSSPPAAYSNEVIVKVRRPGGNWVTWPCRYERNLDSYTGKTDIEIWRFDIPWFMDWNQSWYFTMPVELKFIRNTYDKKSGHLLNTFRDSNFSQIYTLDFPLWLWGTPQVWSAFENTTY